MRFSVGLPTERIRHGDEFVSRNAIVEMARAAEQAGFDACYVTDHPFPPDDWLAAGGHHALDPFVTLALVASATESLRLHTNIMVLPYRNPFLAAKTVATLDVISHGRVILGVAAGYLEAEFRALGVDFESRNESADDALRALKLAWTASGVRFEGRGFAATGNTMLPRPVQQPHPPIWVGGNSKRAIRRAVELADGWIPFPNPAERAQITRSAVLETTDDLVRRIRLMREIASSTGRTAPLDICFSLTAFDKNGFDPQRVVDAVGELEQAGVTWATVRVPGRSRLEYCDNVSRFGETVIQQKSPRACRSMRP